MDMFLKTEVINNGYLIDCLKNIQNTFGKPQKPTFRELDWYIGRILYKTISGALLLTYFFVPFG